ncbi:MAG: C39 family peptidase [Cyanobium sp.]
MNLAWLSVSALIPPEALRLIREFEGCARLNTSDGRIHAYPDPETGGEPFTIGWGTTVYPDGSRVGADDVISQAEADALLLEHVQSRLWPSLSQSIPHWEAMNAPMRAALCSFAYNVGSRFMVSEGFDTLRACLRERRWPDVPHALLLYVNPGSSVEAGLRRRRSAEAALWLDGLKGLPPLPAAGQPLILEAICRTFLKKENRDSSQLEAHQLVAVAGARRWKIETVLDGAGPSQRVRLAYGAGDWWIHRPHWAPFRRLEGEDQGLPGHSRGAARPGARDLAVPHLSQLDNRLNPYGSCNVTCVAMCLHYLGYPRCPGSSLEDELYLKMERLGWDRHDPYDLQHLIGTVPGYRDLFRVDGSFDDVRRAIDAGHPVIMHGYFTRYGHIIVVRGYDKTGFLVNDPYGEWFSSGYDTSRSGERLHYSYDLIARTCSPESHNDPANIWFHTVLRI